MSDTKLNGGYINVKGILIIKKIFKFNKILYRDEFYIIK